MIRIADFRCNSCGKVKEDLIVDGKEYKCNCGGTLERMFTIAKRMQMLPHVCEHMGHEPVYIEDREHFDKELKKRGLYGVPLKKPKNIQYFT